jgi:hypothetical protein
MSRRETERSLLASAACKRATPRERDPQQIPVQIPFSAGVKSKVTVIVEEEEEEDVRECIGVFRGSWNRACAIAAQLPSLPSS